MVAPQTASPFSCAPGLRYQGPGAAPLAQPEHRPNDLAPPIDDAALGHQSPGRLIGISLLWREPLVAGTPSPRSRSIRPDLRRELEAASGDHIAPRAHDALSVRDASTRCGVMGSLVRTEAALFGMAINSFTTAQRGTTVRQDAPFPGSVKRPARNQMTIVCYGAMGCLGFLLNGLGSTLPFLQRELGVARVEVAWYPTMLALGLVLVGLVGDRVVRKVGRRPAFWFALASLGSGSLLLASALSGVISSIGAGIMGIGGALIVLVVPAVLSDEDSEIPAGAITEANAVYSVAAVLAPLSMATAGAVGAGWRPGYLLVPSLVLVALLALGRRTHFPEKRTSGAGETAGTPLARRKRPIPTRVLFAQRWLDILLVVSIEFCLIFWTADYLRTEVHLARETASAVAALLLVGIAVGRVTGGLHMGRVEQPGRLLLASVALASVGFILFWATRRPELAAVGLLITGLGVALLYPLSVSNALAAMPTSPDRASARAALAAGLAVAGGPFLLAALSERVGLRTAFLLVLCLLVVVALNTCNLDKRKPHARWLREA